MDALPVRRLGPGSVVVAALALLFALVVGVGLTLMGVLLAVTLGPWPLAAGVLVTSGVLAGTVAFVRRQRTVDSRETGRQ